MIGVVIAYLLGLQAEQFGANIFVVDGVGIGATREFAPIIVAVIVGQQLQHAETRQHDSTFGQEARRVISTIVAGLKEVWSRPPAALGLLRGRRSSAFPPLAPDIELAGGEFVDEAAVVDGNMVSCRGWGDLAEWSRAFLDVLDRAAVPA